MIFEGKRVLVTGAGGFIGSHLTEALVRTGAQVRTMIRYKADLNLGALSELSPCVLAELEIVRGDLRDLSFVERCISGSDIVFHLGALGSVPYSYENPLAFVEVNVLGTANVIHSSLREEVQRTVIMSTSEVYGSARYVPMDESHPLTAQSPYAATKVAAEKLAESFYRSFQSPITIARAFNTYGPRQSTRALIPSIVSQALRGIVIKVGNRYPIRDFTYVTDTVRALILLASNRQSVGKTINIGTGVALSIEGVVERLGEVLTKRLNITSEEQRTRPATSEVDKLVCDNTLLRELTDWRPEVDFRTGLGHLCRWLKTQPNREERYDT